MSLSSMPSNAEYIGDGVYCWYDGYHLWLVTYDGYKVTNRVALDNHVMYALGKVLERKLGENDEQV